MKQSMMRKEGRVEKDKDGRKGREEKRREEKRREEKRREEKRREEKRREEKRRRGIKGAGMDKGRKKNKFRTMKIIILLS